MTSGRSLVDIGFRSFITFTSVFLCLVFDYGKSLCCPEVVLLSPITRRVKSKNRIPLFLFLSPCCIQKTQRYETPVWTQGIFVTTGTSDSTRLRVKGLVKELISPSSLHVVLWTKGIRNDRHRLLFSRQSLWFVFGCV